MSSWFDFLFGTPAPKPEPEPEPVAEGKEIHVALLALQAKNDRKYVGLRMAWATGNSAEYALGYALKNVHRDWIVAERLVMCIPLAPGLEAGEAEVIIEAEKE